MIFVKWDLTFCLPRFFLLLPKNIWQKENIFLLPALQSIRFYDKMEQLHAENDFFTIISCMFGDH